MAVNKAILIGNLGRDPELRITQSQMPVCRFSLATSERRKDASGNWSDHTEWHNIVTFGKTAENCNTYLKKGSQAFIEGSIRTNKRQDKEGRDRYTTEIIANNVRFLGSRQRATGGITVETMPDSMHGGMGSGPSLVPPIEGLQPADALAANSSSGAGSDGVSFEEDDIPF